MSNTREGLITIALYIFVVCAFSLPLIIAWIVRAVKARLKRLDNIFDLIEESEKYHGKKD